MTPTAAARRLVGLEGWEWTPVMLATLDGAAVRVTAYDVRSGIVSGWIPDLEDDATRGVLLGMLSRRVGGYVWIEPVPPWHTPPWDVRVQHPSGTRRLLASGASWAEAFVAAWEATP